MLIIVIGSLLSFFGLIYVFGLLYDEDMSRTRPTYDYVVLSAVLLWLGWFGLVCAIGIFTNIRRFHDLGWSGSLVALLLIPGAAFVLLLLCLFVPGNPGVNKYGKPDSGTPFPVLHRQATPQF